MSGIPFSSGDCCLPGTEGLTYIKVGPRQRTVGMMNLDMVVHLITEDIYIDIKFTAWTGGGNGGGFTYERSTDQTLGINNLNQMEKLILHPNPAKKPLMVQAGKIF